MEATLRKTGALLTKDLRDLVKNPSTLVCCLMPVAFIAFFTYMMGDEVNGNPEAQKQFLTFMLAFSFCMSAGMASMTTATSAIAEERGKTEAPSSPLCGTIGMRACRIARIRRNPGPNEAAMNRACEAQDELVEDFVELDDPFSRYEYLLGLAAELPVMPDEDKERALKVEGCQSRVWMLAERAHDSTLAFAFESDTLIVRGILRIMQLIYSGRAPADILACPFELPVRAGLDELFEAQRRSGMRAIAGAVRAEAERAASQNRACAACAPSVHGRLTSGTTRSSAATHASISSRVL